MATFAFVTIGVAAHVNQCAALAERLRGRGHRAVFLCHDARVKAAVEERGFEFILLETPRQSVRRPPSPRRLRQARAEVRKASRAVTASREIVEHLDALKPELVLVDYELSDHVIRIQPTGHRLLLVEYHCSARRVPGVPILSSSFVPAGAPLDDARIAATWAWTGFVRRCGFALARLAYGRYEFLTTLRRLAQQHGFDFRRGATLGQWHYVGFPVLPTLYLAVPEFDLPHETPNRAWYAGPQIEDARPRSEGDDEGRLVTRWLEQEDERPLIYCAIGSILSRPEFCRAVIGMAARRPDWRVLLSAGRRALSSDLGQVPDNALLVGRAPQLEVLSHATVMMHHGGAATTAECIHHGVRMVAYRTGIMDSNGNAARIEFHRLGRAVDFDRATPDSMVRDVAAVLGDPAVGEGIVNMRSVFGRYREEDRAVTLLEAAAGLGGDLPPWHDG